MFIEKITLHRFKQFGATSVPLKSGLSLLVGGNNSGKSSLLHALAVWEFCKTILEFTKGRRAWTNGGLAQGIGIGISDFSPMNVPSLKHLWHNLRTQKQDEPDGYTLKVGTAWESGGKKRRLEFGLSLANDRLFIKTTATNLDFADVEDESGVAIAGVVPKVAFLPPFAGITDREQMHSVAMRNRLIGQGLSGGVIRNMLYDLWSANRRERVRLRGTKSKISSVDLAVLRETDPWEILLRTLGEVFGLGLTVGEFDDRYHTHLDIETFRGKVDGSILKKATDDAPRDLMVEGSGFLQWLSVYTLSLSPDVDIVLLDEPDAHLHCLLQLALVERLSFLAKQKDKQVLMATHSTELIKSFDHRCILKVGNGKTAYLSDPAQKVGLLAGIGTHFAPRLHDLAVKKKMLIVENDFDERLLKIWSETLGVAWPPNLATWLWNGGHRERRQLFVQLKKEIPALTALSLRDRDDEADGTADATLKDKGVSDTKDGFVAMKWRRRHIENYLLHPAAIARASGKSEKDVRDYFSTEHSLALNANAILSDAPFPIRDARGKEIMTVGTKAIDAVFKVTRDDIAKAMQPNEIAEDVKTFIKVLGQFCA